MSYILKFHKNIFATYIKVKRFFFRCYLLIRLQPTFLDLMNYLMFYAEDFVNYKIIQATYRNNKPFDYALLPYEEHLDDINKVTDLLLPYYFTGKPKVTKALLNFFETTLLDMEPNKYSMLEFLFITDNEGKKYYSYIRLFFTDYQ